MNSSSVISKLTLSLVLAMFLNGCATTGGAQDASLSPAQQQLRQEASLLSDTSLAAAGGAALGALAGCLLGNCKPEAVIGGALAGGVAGIAAGYYVDSQNVGAANSQAALQNGIAK